MFAPLLAGVIFSVVFDVLCFTKPEFARRFLGGFFLAMGLGVNLAFVVTAPHMYAAYANGSPVALVRWFGTTVAGANPVVFGVALMAFEVAVGVMLLMPGRRARMALVASIVFVAALGPVSVIQVSWAAMIVGQVALLVRESRRVAGTLDSASARAAIA